MTGGLGLALLMALQMAEGAICRYSPTFRGYCPPSVAAGIPDQSRAGGGSRPRSLGGVGEANKALRVDPGQAGCRQVKLNGELAAGTFSTFHRTMLLIARQPPYAWNFLRFI